jgi:hypothetical protein
MDRQRPATGAFHHPRLLHAFRDFAKRWWNEQPGPKGFTTERDHAAYWDSYDEKTAARLRDIVQETIDRYFPDGRPAGK